MVKSAEKTEQPAPVPEVAPPMLKTVVSVKATIPLMQYGNIEMFISQEYLSPASADDDVRDLFISDTLTHLREHLAMQVLPLAEAEVVRAKPQLVKEKFPDSWMQRNNPTYRWLRVASPDMTIQAMHDILGNMSIALE